MLWNISVHPVIFCDFQDKTIIMMSVAFSTLNYIVYIPELVLVR